MEIIHVRKSILAQSILIAVLAVSIFNVPVHADTEAQTEESDQQSQVPVQSDEDQQQRFHLPISVELTAGILYDDNVSVAELDTNTELGDFAALIGLDLGYEHGFGQGTELDLGYSFSQRAYFEETNFDLQIHTGSVNLKHNFSNFDLGASFYATHARLGGDGFLDIQQYSPYVTKFLTPKLYLRGAYAYRDKSFDNNPARNGDVHALETDFYYFLDGVRQYVVTGYRYENEDTLGEQFDFVGHTIDFRYALRFHLGELPVRLRADWRYETRNYDSITPSIGAVRDDDRHRLRLRMELPLTERFDLLFEYQYRNYSSNLPSADYTDNRIETQVRFTL